MQKVRGRGEYRMSVEYDEVQKRGLKRVDKGDKEGKVEVKGVSGGIKGS